jgi:trk system potassium uptake protein TrkA
MNILICGAGKVGTSLIRYLQNNYKVTVIDYNNDHLNNLSSEFEIKTICGQPSDPELLKKADIEKTDVVISALPNDDLNLFVCHICAYIFKVPKRIARITNTNFLLYRDSIINAFSVDNIISPEFEVANYIANKVEDLCILENIKVFNDELSILLISINNPDLKEIRDGFQDLNIIWIAVLRGKKILDQSKIEELANKDKLLIAVQTQDIIKIIKIFQHKDENKKFIIIGGGKVGFYLSQRLETIANTSEITVVEQDKKRAQFIAEQSSKIKVINGSGVDVNMLEELDIDDNTLIISVTNSDQVNIFSQLLLKKTNNEKNITLLQDPSYIKLGESIGVNNIISPAQITLDSFSKLVMNTDMKNPTILKYDMCNNLFVFLEIELKNTDIIQKLITLPDSFIRSIILFKNKKLLIFDKNNSNLEIYDKILICALSAKVEQLMQYFG